MKKILLLTTVFLLANCLIVFAQEEQAEELTIIDTMPNYNADNYQDPFTPQIKKEEEKKLEAQSLDSREIPISEFNVQGMIWNSDRPQAIIEGQILGIGDEIKGAKIVEISKEGVKLLIEGKIIMAKPKVTFDNKQGKQIRRL